MYTISQLKNINDCDFKGYMSMFSYKSEKTKYLHLLELYKGAIFSQDLQWGKYFDENIDDKYYFLEKSKSIDRNIFVKHLERFHRWLHGTGREIKYKNVSDIVMVNGEKYFVKADMIVNKGSHYEIVKISSSSPSLNYKARSENNKPENNFELYLLQQLGKKYTNSEFVIPALYHLKGKYDEKENYELFLNGESSELTRELNNLEAMKKVQESKREINKLETQAKKIRGILTFNGDDGCHVISCDDGDRKFNTDYILKKLDNLTSKELSIFSEKCISSKCSDCKNYVICQATQHNKVALNEVKEEKKVRKKSSPTKAQQQVIEAEKGFFRVNSAPGSGKSFSNIQRTVRLLNENKPEDILMITFTNKGAEELRDRIDSQTTYNKRKLNIFTFNGYGSSVIEKEYERLGYTKVPEIVNKIEKVDVLKRILNQNEEIEWLNYKQPLLNMPNAKGCVYELISYFDRIKSFGDVELDETKKEDVYKIYNIYNETLRSLNRMEYADQLLLCVKLFEEHPELVQEYGFKHIMVDEYQDTDKIQIKLLKLLTAYDNFKSLMGTGDTAQAIYGFRNTTPQNMIDFDKDFNNSKDIFMEDNFRSTHQICDLSNRLDELNKKRIDKTMKSQKGIGESVSLLEYETTEKEYDNISNIIKKELESGRKLQDFSIISRTSKELIEISKILNKNDIPTRLDIPEIHMRNHNVRLAINLSKYLCDFEADYYLLEYVMNLNPKLSVGEINNIVNSIEEYISSERSCDDFDMANVFFELISKMDMEDEIFTKFMISSYDKYSELPFTDYATFLQKHDFYNDDSQAEKDDKKYEAVTLTTAHSSKGKEWKIVINVIDKYKYDGLKKNQDLLEEERRLLFVSASRAEDKLYITYQTNEDKKRGSGKYCGFADEIRKIIE